MFVILISFSSYEEEFSFFSRDFDATICETSREFSIEIAVFFFVCAPKIHGADDFFSSSAVA